MGKIKTRKAASKRFRAIGGSKKTKFKRSKANTQHILTKKDTKGKRKNRRGTVVNDSNTNTLKKLMPYD